MRRLLLSGAMGVMSLAAAVRGLSAQQPARISGQIVNAVTGEGIADAVLLLDDERRQSSSEGRFQFGSVDPGNHRLEVRAIGYAAELTELDVSPGEDRVMRLSLNPVPVELDSIQVTTSPWETSIAGADLVRRGPDLASALDGWEGVVVSRTGAGNAAVAQVRGSAPEEVLVLVDGFPVNDPFTGRADLSRIATRDVERISLSLGAETVRSGNRAIAGVISIDTHRAVTPEISVGGGSYRSASGRIAAGSGQVHAALNVERLPERFGYSRPDGAEAERANAGGQAYTFNARADVGADLTLRGSISDLGLPGTTTNPSPAAHGLNHALFLGVRAGGATSGAASIEWLDTRVQDRAPPPGFPAYDSRTQGWGASLGLTRRRDLHVGSWTGAYTLGLDSRHDRFAGDAVRDNATFTRAGAAASANLVITTGASTWSIAPAFRLDWWTGRRAPPVSGRLDLTLSRGATTYSAGIGSAVSTPVLADLLFHDGVGVRINPDLRPERVVWEASAGIRRHGTVFGAGVVVGVRGFYGRIADMVLWSPNFRFVWSPANFNVLRRGGEATVEFHPVASVSLNATMTLSAVTYDQPGGAQVRYRPRSSNAVYASWSPASWRLTARWTHLGSRSPFNTGTNLLSPVDLLNAGIERRIGSMMMLRGEVRDLADVRPTYIAGFPTPGRSFHLSLNLDLP